MAKRKPSTRWEERIVEVVMLHDELPIGELAAILNAQVEDIRDRIDELADVELDGNMVRFIGSKDDYDD